MEIKFLGATRTVTGSKYLLKSDKKVLVDCGLFQGLKELRLRNWADLPVNPKTIDAVVLTHAHLDHSGYLPLLVKNGFSGKIYGTPLTLELCKVLLLDSGHLQEEGAKRANKYGYSKHKPALPLYTKEDAAAVFSQFQPIAFHKNFDIGDLSFCFNRAGHILGAATVMVKYQHGSLLFSGDLGRSSELSSEPCILPREDIFHADYLVIESTYGDRLHEDVDPEESLGDAIRQTAERGGTLIIPAFAVGRTQSMLYYIHNLKQAGKIPSIPVFLDSPMAQDITDIMLKNAEDHPLAQGVCREVSKVAQYVNTVDESKQIDTYAFPKIIISASGMATGGRVLHHIKAYAEDKRNMILFAGYQAAGTRGEALMHGRKQIKMFGEMLRVNAEVKMLTNVSAHADYSEILNWLSKFKAPPKKVFITHGEIHAAEALRDKIEKKFNWPCVIPKYLQTEEL
ncbi:MAG: MBL fold metallo-hydrolase [Gammaproteobacteria bacterium]|nr:MBL fold metallo-hydrolase [Gammaproteobacteria bacterium]